MLRWAAVTMALALWPAGAQAVDFSGLWNPFKTPVERYAQQVDDARQRGDLDLAQALLANAERVVGKGHAALMREEGLLARDRGRLADAAELLGRAADLEPTSDARVEQAAVLVPLGRWPEAVEVLGRAFDERGASLRADDILVDPRFAPLVGFSPFQELVKRVRGDQSGPLGRILLKFEHIDEAVRTQGATVGVLDRWMQAVGRLLAYAGTAVVALVFFVLLAAFGVRQTGLVRPPWTLVVGMVAASSLWYLGARIAAGSGDDAVVTITTAFAVLFVPWGLGLAARAIWRRWRGVRSLDPFDAAHLPHTLSLVDEVRRIGHQVLVAKGPDRPELLEELRRAAAPLAERLAGVEPPPEPEREEVSVEDATAAAGDDLTAEVVAQGGPSAAHASAVKPVVHAVPAALPPSDGVLGATTATPLGTGGTPPPRPRTRKRGTPGND